MLKLSITLPNNAQINLESEDGIVIDRILGIVLADVTRALLEMPPVAAGGRSAAAEPRVPAAPAPNQPSVKVEADLPETGSPVNRGGKPIGGPGKSSRGGTTRGFRQLLQHSYS